MDDRVEAMRILSAGNTIMMLVLGAILGLQVSADYRSRRLSAGCDVVRCARFFFFPRHGTCILAASRSRRYCQ